MMLHCLLALWSSCFQSMFCSIEKRLSSVDSAFCFEDQAWITLPMPSGLKSLTRKLFFILSSFILQSMLLNLSYLQHLEKESLIDSKVFFFIKFVSFSATLSTCSIAQMQLYSSGISWITLLISSIYFTLFSSYSFFCSKLFILFSPSSNFFFAYANYLFRPSTSYLLLFMCFSNYLYRYWSMLELEIFILSLMFLLQLFSRTFNLQNSSSLLRCLISSLSMLISTFFYWNFLSMKEVLKSISLAETWIYIIQFFVFRFTIYWLQSSSNLAQFLLYLSYTALSFSDFYTKRQSSAHFSSNPSLRFIVPSQSFDIYSNLSNFGKLLERVRRSYCSFLFFQLSMSNCFFLKLSSDINYLILASFSLRLFSDFPQRLYICLYFSCSLRCSTESNTQLVTQNLASDFSN